MNAKVNWCAQCVHIVVFVAIAGCVSHGDNALSCEKLKCSPKSEINYDFLKIKGSMTSNQLQSDISLILQSFNSYALMDVSTKTKLQKSMGITFSQEKNFGDRSNAIVYQGNTPDDLARVELSLSNHGAHLFFDWNAAYFIGQDLSNVPDEKLTKYCLPLEKLMNLLKENGFHPIDSNNLYFPIGLTLSSTFVKADYSDSQQPIDTSPTITLISSSFPVKNAKCISHMSIAQSIHNH